MRSTTKHGTRLGLAFALLTLVAPVVVQPSAVIAEDVCEPIGIADKAVRTATCEELKDILFAPVRSGATRSRNSGGLSAQNRAVLEQFGVFAEAYRAHPNRTLELIERIRNAGGLNAN